MKVVYIIIYYDWEEASFHGVFSTKERAEARVQSLRLENPRHTGQWCVESWVVDSEG